LWLEDKEEEDIDYEFDKIEKREESTRIIRRNSCFGGLEVACWPLVPKFAGTNTAEAVGFFQGERMLSTPFSEEK
jgi:hypothetical protein